MLDRQEPTLRKQKGATAPPPKPSRKKTPIMVPTFAKLVPRIKVGR